MPLRPDLGRLSLAFTWCKLTSPWENNTGIEHSWESVASHSNSGVRQYTATPCPCPLQSHSTLTTRRKYRPQSCQFPLDLGEVAAPLQSPRCQLISLVTILIFLFSLLSFEVFPKAQVISGLAMATLSTIQPARQDSTLSPNLAPNLHLNLFQRGLAISDLDFKDNRYPSLSLSSKPTNGPSMILTSSDTHPRDDANLVPSDTRTLTSAALADPTNDRRILNDEKHDMLHPYDADGLLPATAVSYALPGNTRRPVERCSSDDNNNNKSNGTATPLLNGSNFVDSKLFNDSFKSFGESLTQPPPSPPTGARDIPPSLYPASMRQPPYPLHDGVAVSRISSANGLSSSRPYSPTLAIPISPNPRAYPQHPTYITAAATPDPINPILSPNLPQPQEEVCVECAMRDQDMADVVVVGPGIWDRESDILFEELLRREEEEEASGISASDCSSRPRARGGRLTEQNLKLWATMVSVFVFGLKRY